MDQPGAPAHENAMRSAADIESAAADWFARQDSAELSMVEQAAFDAWLGADIRHRVAYLRLQKTWDRTGRLRDLRPLDGEIDTDLLSTHEDLMTYASPRWLVDTNAGMRGTSEGSTMHPGRRWALALAGVLAVVAIGLAAWTVAYLASWQSFSTELGGFSRIALEDGSTVDLNTDSALSVRITEDERRVTLVRGEARFKVAHDPRRPFQVEAAGAAVRAIGTSFSVRVTGKEEVEVLVTEGRVAIGDPDELSTSVPTVSAGQAAKVQSKSVYVHEIDLDDITRRLAWTAGQLSFDGETLEEAVAEFNRYNRRQLRIVDRQIAQRRIGGSFDAMDPVSFAAALETTFGIRARYANSNGEPSSQILLEGTRQ
jgi:transmembrane sensor